MFWGVWDALVWIGVLFPFFTGGVWYQSPTLKIELAEVTVPVLIAGVLAGLIGFQKGWTGLYETTSVRFLKRLLSIWRNWIESSPFQSLFSATLFFGALFSLSGLRRHWAFESNAVDLGIFTNAIFNLTHGGGYVSSFKDGINLFIDHQSWIFWGLAPLFKVLPYPETLLVAQGFALAAGGGALFLLGKQSGSRFAAFFPLAYWCYLPLRNANSFDFHPEVAMIPLFLWGIALTQETSPRWRLSGAFALVLALTTKESAGVVAVGIALAWMAGAAPRSSGRFTRFWAAPILLISGFTVFIFDTKWVPGFLGGAYPYTNNYKQFGDGLLAIAAAPILKPGLFFGQLLGPARLNFLLWTLGPFCFLPILGWRAFLAAIPGMAILFLSEGDHRVSIIYHYVAEPSIGFFWGYVAGVAFLEGRISSPKWKKALPAVLIFAALLFFGRSELYRIRFHSETAHEAWLSNDLIPAVSPGVTISSSSALSPHLATRPWSHHLPRFLVVTAKPPVPVDCVFFDRGINNFPLNSEEFEHGVPDQLQKLGFKILYQCQTLAVWTRGKSCLISQPLCPSVD